MPPYSDRPYPPPRPPAHNAARRTRCPLPPAPHFVSSTRCEEFASEDIERRILAGHPTLAHRLAGENLAGTAALLPIPEVL